jgi:hypothetical protein
MDQHVTLDDPASHGHEHPWRITVIRFTDGERGMTREAVVHEEVIVGVDTSELNHRAMLLMEEYGGDGFYVQRPACYWVDEDRRPAVHLGTALYESTPDFGGDLDRTRGRRD